MTGLDVSIETVTRDESSVCLALRGEFDLENISVVRLALAGGQNPVGGGEVRVGRALG